MKKLIILVLLLWAVESSLFADEYISDAYLQEVSIEAEMSDELMETLPIAKTIEEQAREREQMQQESLTGTQLVEEEGFSTPLGQTAQAVSYEVALKQAKEEGKIIMLSIRSTNCKYCDQMDAETLSDKSVKEALEANFITIHYNQDLETLPLGLQEGATPMFIFVNSNEDILNMYPGIRNPNEFKEVLDQILKQ